MTRKNLTEKYLDGEVLFRKYFEMGDAKSYGRLARWALSEGMARKINPSKSNPDGLPHMGVWKSMWRWASTHGDQAWKIYLEHVPDASYEQWILDMRDKILTAWQYTTNSRYERFLKEYGWK
jgi:hypothetical protein